MKHEWFRQRGYKHFDAPVGDAFADKACDPAFVEHHAWSPLIHYVKRVKRYKPNNGKTEYKDRPIMFASHRDACILAKYAFDINEKLDLYYNISGLHQNVIAYRRLGRANYHFSADAYLFAKERGECVVLCFDIKGFFDNLDHGILKDRLKRLLGVSELPMDWFAVFRQVTKFRLVERKTLEENAEFKAKLKAKSREPFATIAEIKAASIPIIVNPNKFGIPQGTPISAAFSNLYMLDVDRIMVDKMKEIGGLYQRYSDDILIICDLQSEDQLKLLLESTLRSHQLKINSIKNERAIFSSESKEMFQYLGFNISQVNTVIRPSSLSRQWRKAKRAIRQTKIKGKIDIAKGRTKHISTKRLRQRFWPTGARNFSKYARRAANVLGSKNIIRQTLRFERMIDKAIRDIEK